MSKIISAYFRSATPNNLREKLVSICRKLEPDNISANKPNLIQSENGALAIMNPMGTILVHEDNILMGHVVSVQKEVKWYSEDQEYPDGSYALFRNNTKESQFITDALASRTIWYYFDEDKFLAATSQRAIILFIGNLEFDERCIPWMLSTGSLGPEYSWDKRIRRIPPSSILTLNRETWKISIRSRPISFKTLKMSSRAHRERLQNAIASSLKHSDLSFERWTLPLSGGYDSRAILYFILKKSKEILTTITWGLAESINIKGNDAYVAKEIAQTLNVSHTYYHTNINEEPLKDIFERFIKMGEGRIDHISGYMDGFSIWKTLFEDGIQGIIRGDEAFGWSKVSNPINVRYVLGSALCSDYMNLSAYQNKYKLPLQKMPTHLERQKGESLSTWRDRLYHEYRVPTILAALSDLKLGYIEQATPLLSYEILNIVRKIPDKLRTDKKIFREIVDALEPKIEYANAGANAKLGDILQQKEVVKILQDELCADYASSIFPMAFLETVVKNLKVQDSIHSRTHKANVGGKHQILRLIKRNTPNFVKKLWPTKPYQSVNHNILAFRIYIIIYMHRLLNAECSENE